MASLWASSARPARLSDAATASADYGATASPDWRTVPWREHLRDIDIDGARLHYVDIGSGDAAPLVFVHGLGGCWQNWLENIPRAAQSRRVIALDLPGFGASEMPEGDITIDAYAATVDALCQTLGFESVVLVGNSMGGEISADVAIRYPTRVERLVLVDAAGYSVNDLREEPARTIFRVIAAPAVVQAIDLESLMRRPKLRHVLLAAVMRHPTRLALDLLLEHEGSTGAPAFALATDAIANYDFRERLPQIACPTLIVQGADDVLVPLDDAFEFHRLIPDSRVHVFEDTGHVPMLERPQPFNDLLMEFVRCQVSGVRSQDRVGGFG
jgi:pimeloyl-ACP methyl ester carboxylesterase